MNIQSTPHRNGDDPSYPASTGNADNKSSLPAMSLAVISPLEDRLTALPHELLFEILEFLSPVDRRDRSLTDLSQASKELNRVAWHYLDHHPRGRAYVDVQRCYTPAYWKTRQDKMLDSANRSFFYLSDLFDTVNEGLTQIADNLPAHHGISIHTLLNDELRISLPAALGRLRDKAIVFSPCELGMRQQEGDVGKSDVEHLLRAIPVGNAVRLILGGFAVLGRRKPVANELAQALRVMRDHPVIYSLCIQWHEPEYDQPERNTEAILCSDEFIGMLSRPTPLCELRLGLRLGDEFYFRLAGALEANRGAGIRRLDCQLTRDNQLGIRALSEIVSRLNAGAATESRMLIRLRLQPRTPDIRPPFRQSERAALADLCVEFSSRLWDSEDESDTEAGSSDPSDTVSMDDGSVDGGAG